MLKKAAMKKSKMRLNSTAVRRRRRIYQLMKVKRRKMAKRKRRKRVTATSPHTKNSLTCWTETRMRN
jgi:hypothetical protein